MACCQTYAAREHRSDPQPEPPAKFVDRARGGAAGRGDQGPCRPPPVRRPGRAAAAAAGPGEAAAASRRLVRTVVATTRDVERSAGRWPPGPSPRAGSSQAEGVPGRRLACAVGALRAASGGRRVPRHPGLRPPAGAPLRGGRAAEGRGSDAAWGLYVEWIALAWAGQVVALLAALQVVQDRLGEPPRRAKEDDPRRVVAETIGYVRNNRERMDYPSYRRQGLPISRRRGEHDQADEPADQGEREVLADGRGRGGGAGASGVPQRGRSRRSVLGPAAPRSGGRARSAPSAPSRPGPARPPGRSDRPGDSRRRAGTERDPDRCQQSGVSRFFPLRKPWRGPVPARLRQPCRSFQILPSGVRFRRR